MALLCGELGAGSPARRGTEYSPKLPQFLAALSAGAPAEQAFASVYRKDLGQIEADLRNHWAQTSVPAATLKRQTSYSPVLSTIRSQAEPNPLMVELFLANILAASPQKQREAEARLTALESEYPATPEVEESLAYLVLRQKRTAEAKEHMRAAVRCGSRNADLLVRYASIAEQDGATAEQVLPLLEEALELDPENDLIRLRSAQRTAKTGSFQRAISHSGGCANRNDERVLRLLVYRCLLSGESRQSESGSGICAASSRQSAIRRRADQCRRSGPLRSESGRNPNRSSGGILKTFVPTAAAVGERKSGYWAEVNVHC